MKFHNIIFVFILLLSLSAHANDELNAALNAYEQGNFKFAFQQFSLLAEQENVEAQYNLAFMYFGGDGVAQNDIKAAYWFEKAAKQGHSRAQDTLAYMYLNGRGLKASRVKAYAWYSVAAKNGIFLAQNICDNLKKEMGPTERAHAEMLRKEYIKKFLN